MNQTAQKEPNRMQVSVNVVFPFPRANGPALAMQPWNTKDNKITTRGRDDDTIKLREAH